MTRWNKSRLCKLDEALLPLNRESLAWAAGLFDGEGSIVFGWKDGRTTNSGVTPSYPNLAMSVRMTDVRPINRFYFAIGGIGQRYKPHRGSGPDPDKIYKLVYGWGITGFEGCQAVIAMLWFKLGEEKKEQAIHKLNLVRKYSSKR